MSTAPPTVRRKKPVGGRGFSAYTEYVPSDIPGVAELPAHWRAKPLKRVVTINAEDLPEATDPDYEIAYVDIGNVALVGGIESTEAYRFEEAPSRARRKARDGDTIISTVRTYLRAVAQIRDPAPNLVVSTGFAVLRPNSEIDAGFLYRLVQCEEFVGRVVAYSTGVSYPAIAPTTLGMFHVWLPPLPEQRVIAAFLDHQTRRIDELIAKKRRLIELLAEKRSALISHAVTKGLNPAAPMKPSGVDWLGDVPAHWDVKPLKYIVSRIGSGKTPRGGAEVYVSDGVMLLRSQNVYDDGLRLDDVVYIDEDIDVEMAGTRVRSNDVLLNITGASIGRCAIVPNDMPAANVNQHVCIIRPAAVSAAFLHAFLCSKAVKDWIRAEENGTSREGLNFRQVGSIALPAPPPDEQQAIMAIVTRHNERIDAMHRAAEDAVSHLCEYRQALVSAAVTGKIDVREEAGV